jgi:DNA-binding CsgD family transcriptional regulator
MDAAQYDALVAGFYRAATGDIAWEVALEAMRRAFRCVTVSAETYDLPSRALLSMQYANRALHPAALDYLRSYNVDNPRLAMGMAETPRTWVYCHEHIPEDMVARDRVYQEFYIPYDLRYCAGAYLPVDERTGTCMAALRSHREGPIEGEERQWLERLGGHLLEARSAYERVRRLASQALAGSTLLSAFPYPMWLIDGERHVFFANGPGRREMQRGQRTRLRGGTRLELAPGTADRDLGLQLLSLYEQGHGARAVIDLRRAGAEPPVLLHLHLLEPEQALKAFGNRPLALATLFDAHEVNSLDPFALARIFQFTPAEAKVATQLADGLTAEQIAAQNGTRISTVRTQISSVLAKLGVTRQAEAVRVLRQGEALWALGTA